MPHEEQKQLENQCNDFIECLKALGFKPTDKKEIYSLIASILRSKTLHNAKNEITI